jgi:hypothetical protein
MMQREWRRDCLEFLEQANEAEPEKFNLSVPRSRCGSCGHQITLLENIPIISYLALGGKCSSCRASISAQYPLVEVFTGIASVIIGWHFGVSMQTLAALFLTWCLIAASGIDIGHRLLPDIRQPRRQRDRCDGRLSEFVDGVHPVQTCDRQGRHGARRLQTTRNAGRLVGVDAFVRSYPDFFSGRGDHRH